MQEPSAEPFLPPAPATLDETGMGRRDLEAIALKLLAGSGIASGRRMAEHIKLPFGVMHDVLQGLKSQMLVTLKGAAAMSDYEYELTPSGHERARRLAEQCTYFGAAPVPLADFIASVERQSLRRARPRLSDLCEAFRDLLMSPAVLSQIGQAVYSGKGLFLFGPPGNGKTSIAERVMSAVNQPIWIPRTIFVGGEIIRYFDPSVHDELPLERSSELLQSERFDRRWVRIRRPTVVAGGELTLEHLECRPNPATGILEAPLQFKSTCGALVIDDFGRQRMSAQELLNRWIVPLEKGFDYLNLPSGRHLQIPFDQLLVFATNLRPHDLVDEAFLRRIPYKIEVFDPDERQFRELFRRASARMHFEYREPSIDYLIEQHYRRKTRSFRFCHVRDLLEQVRTFCEFHQRPFEVIPETLDIAANNYFAGL